MTFRDIIEEYPSVEKEDILACISYGAEISRERFVVISAIGS